MSFLPDGPPGAGELLAADPAGQGPTIPPAPVLAALLAVAVGFWGEVGPSSTSVTNGCLSFQVSSSKQAVAGAASTAAFFLCEGLLGRHFDVVPNGAAEPQPGDLFLFPLASRGPGWWGAHAGVYCGDGEIIHLEGTSGTSPTGIVAKHGKSHLLRTRGPAKVLRMKGGLDAAALQWRIRAAMDMVLDYDAVTCNCIHFALALLGLGQLTGDMMFPALQ
ncbi:uncharacterized protein LOC125698262 isoform X12 [Lagopus muta]|uniref:uncharacterized protein LOC125698262 isoform X12 n=1 Tax=Lagopus muta TaxID=64668 RepID=UPI00209EC3F2|nr:uncharacterized protein LOC125698262 isoform X12 [Lagopus muta]